MPSPMNVSVPHTWNVQEGLEDYRRAGWYEYTLSIPEDWRGCRIRIHFEAGQKAERDDKDYETDSVVLCVFRTRIDCPNCLPVLSVNVKQPVTDRLPVTGCLNLY